MKTLLELNKEKANFEIASTGDNFIHAHNILYLFSLTTKPKKKERHQVKYSAKELYTLDQKVSFTFYV